MDNRLVLAVLFVTLSWMSMGINAQTNMTTASPSNMTSGPNMTTPMGHNATGSPNATMGPHMTTVMGNNATMAGNMTTAMGNNATMAANMTTAMGNNATMAANMTTAMVPNTTGTTTAAPLVANTTVEALTTEISNTQCGTEQLCAAEPAECNPSSGSCFFLAAKQLSGQNFEFGLAGESEGYIAASLSTDSTVGGNDTTYICANNNGSVKFFGALLDNGKLTVTELNVNSVKGKVNGTRIQCTFAATVPSPSTRTSTFSLSISTGPFNSTTNDLGAPTTQLKTAPVNLANPNTTVTNELSANTTAAPTTTTTSHAITFKQSLTPALLIVAAVLGLAML